MNAIAPNPVKLQAMGIYNALFIGFTTAPPLLKSDKQTSLRATRTIHSYLQIQ